MKRTPKKSSRFNRLLFNVIALTGIAVASIYLFAFDDKEDVVNSINSQADLLYTQTTAEFKAVSIDKPVAIPRDVGQDTSYQHAWWHFFANVQDEAGNRYGIQWSYFRISNNPQDVPGWQNSQLYISHIVVSNDSRVWKEQRIARGGIGQAGVVNAPFKLWLDNWSWTSLNKTPFPGELKAEAEQFSVQLSSTVVGPYVLPGERGYVSKGENNKLASHNLTAPFINVSGELDLGKGQPIAVQGEAWMSKEWGSGLLDVKQKGWDWFVFHLDKQTTLSIHHYRYQDAPNHVLATLSTNSGKVVSLKPQDISIVSLGEEILAGQKSIPLRWQIKVPKYGIDLTTQAQNTNLWLPFVMPYWEGPITTDGSHKIQGFMQLAGY